MRKELFCRILLLFAFLLPAVVSLHAETPRMTVRLTDGTQLNVDLDLGNYSKQATAGYWTYFKDQNAPVMLCLSSGPTTKEESGRIVAAYDSISGQTGKIWFETEVNKINDISFAPLSSSGIDKITSEPGIDVSLSDGKIAFRGVSAPLAISIFTDAGIRVHQQTINSDSEISLARFGMGTYIVRVGKSSFKIFVK